jgi:hypothetical protein
MIGTNGAYVPYDFKVLVNDTAYTTGAAADGYYTGTSSALERISLIGLTDYTGEVASGPKIQIVARDNTVFEWAKAIGYYGSANPDSNDIPQGVAPVDAFVGQDKLVKVDVLATETMYLKPENAFQNKVGNNFGMFKYYGCTGLTNMETIAGLVDITEVGDNFKYGTYMGCTSLVEPSDISSFSELTIVGKNFEAHKYEGDTSLTSREDISVLSKLPEAEKSKPGFMLDTYAGCTSL